MCSPTDPKVACDERRAAFRRGDFGPDFDLDAWTFIPEVISSFRDPCDKAIWQQDRGNYTGEAFSWHCCPWCGNDLPSPVMLREMHERKAWGDKQQEDGA
jgi:hypothetical protein